MGKDMKNRAVKIGIIAGLLPHLFCCVLPVVLGIIGMIVPDITDHKIVPESAEIWLFIFSGLMLTLSWIMHFSRSDCDCEHCGATHHHRTQRIILIIITIITIAGIAIHLITHH
jgi:cytochrome c biogenesis protein CcdA